MDVESRAGLPLGPGRSSEDLRLILLVWKAATDLADDARSYPGVPDPLCEFLHHDLGQLLTTHPPDDRRMGGPDVPACRGQEVEPCLGGDPPERKWVPP